MATHALMEDPDRTTPRAHGSGARWTDEKKDTLRRLWKERRTSGEIARSIGGVSRNAVMGMVNRLGLMGHGGSREGALSLAEAKRFVHEAFGERYAHSIPGHFQALVAIAGTMCGRDVGCIATFLRSGEAGVQRALDLFEETGVWRAGEDVPPRWEDETSGNVALVMDCMVAIGRIRRIQLPDGDWEYRA